MDIAEHSTRKNHSDSTNVKEYDAKKVVELLQLMGNMMARSTLTNIEAGKSNIKASGLKALQVLFGVEYHEFLKD